MICKLSVGAILMALVIHTGARGENAWPHGPDVAVGINPEVLVNAGQVRTSIFIVDSNRMMHLALDDLDTNFTNVQLDVSPTARGNGMFGVGTLNYVDEDGVQLSQEFPVQGRYRVFILGESHTILYPDGSAERETATYSHDHTVRLRGGSGTRMSALLTGQRSNVSIDPDSTFFPEESTIRLEAEGRIAVDRQFNAMSGYLLALFEEPGLLDIDEIEIQRSAPGRAAGVAPVVDFEDSLPIGTARVRAAVLHNPWSYRLDTSVPGRSRTSQFLGSHYFDSEEPSTDPVEMILTGRTLAGYHRYVAPGMRYEKIYTYSAIFPD